MVDDSNIMQQKSLLKGKIIIDVLKIPAHIHFLLSQKQSDDLHSHSY